MSKIKSDHLVTVKQLIAYLDELDQDAVVVLSSDAEGNKFSPVVLEHGEGLYEQNSTWSGEWINLEDEAYENGDASYDKENSYKAVFLFPVN